MFRVMRSYVKLGNGHSTMETLLERDKIRETKRKIMGGLNEE